MLSEQDKNDLLGLVSGFGSPESDARAQALAQSDEEASCYLQRLRLLTQSLAPPSSDAALPSLSQFDVDRMTQSAYARWRRRRVRRLLTSLGAVAAVLVVTIGLTLFKKAASGQASFQTMRVASWQANAAVPSFRETRVPVGQPLASTDDDLGATRFSDGTALVLPPKSRARREAHGMLLIEQGSVYLQTPLKCRLRAGPLTVTLDQGEAVLSPTARFIECSVYSGSANVSVGNRSLAVPARHRAIWNIEDKSLQLVPEESPPPRWAERGLEILSVSIPNR